MIITVSFHPETSPTSTLEHWDAFAGVPYVNLGNCGSCDEEMFVQWVRNGFKPQVCLNKLDELVDINELKTAVEKAQAAGYKVKMNCGCGEGWQYSRCNQECSLKKIATECGVDCDVF